MQSLEDCVRFLWISYRFRREKKSQLCSDSIVDNRFLMGHFPIVLFSYYE